MENLVFSASYKFNLAVLKSIISNWKASLLTMGLLAPKEMLWDQSRPILGVKFAGVGSA